MGRHGIQVKNLRIVIPAVLVAVIGLAAVPTSAMAIACMSGKITGPGPYGGEGVVPSIYNASREYDGTISGNNNGNWYACRPPGTYYVEFPSPGGPGDNYISQYWMNSSSLFGASPVVLVEGETTEHIDAAMVQGGFVKGTITEAGTGQPVHNMTVKVLEGASSLSTSMSLGDGSYVTGLLAPGTYTIEVSGNPIYATLDIPNVHVASGATTTSNAVLQLAGLGGGGGGGGGGGSPAQPVPVAQPLIEPPPSPAKPLKCHKGFKKEVKKGSTSCVRVKHKHHPPAHH